MQALPSLTPGRRPASLRPRTVIALLALLAAFTTPSPRASAATPPATAAAGTIEGRVFNPRSGTTVENARVSVEGGTLVTFTDADGNFLLAGLPAGNARIRVFYTGFTPQIVDVAVAAGQTVQRDITLLAARGEATAADDTTVKLDKFVVGESREMSGAALAINDQRFAANIRNVVSTDEFGAVAEGNVTEFLKYLPGISIDLSGGDGRTVSIDGAPAANTPITIGGVGLSSPTGTGRAIEVGFFNLNNISRIEVSQSPTPDAPGKALAGAVNLVPRSSFERARPEFNGSLYMMMRDDYRGLGKGATLYRDPRQKVWPGADLSWVVPVNKNFGFSIAAGGSTQFSSQDRVTNVWRGVGTATNGAAFPNTVPGRPYLSQFTIQDAPKESSRDSLGVTLDFRLSARDRIALSYQYSSFDGEITARTLAFAPTQIVAASISPNSVQGVAGAGVLTLNNGNNRIRENRTYLPTFSWRHDGPVWKFDFATGRAYGKNAIRDMDKDRFLAVSSRRTGVTIGFADTGFFRPGIITVADNATGRPLDPYSLENYSLNTLTSTPQRASDINFTATANARRDFLWRVPVTLRTGLDFRQSSRDARQWTSTYTYVGADGRQNTTNGTAVRFLDPVFSTRFAPYGFPQIQYPDNKEVFAYWRKNPNEFTLDENNLYRSNVTNSKHAQESVSATYLRGDVSLLDRRLLLVGGVRVEQTNIEADGPLTDLTLNVQRDAQGRPLRNAAGAVIPITTDALASSRLTFLERSAHAKKEYLRLFPSLNVTFNLRENLIARAAVSTSIGPPDFNQYAGGVSLPNTDNVPSNTNRIVVNNVAIKPWTANTVKVRLEYYFAGVGQISIGAYRRHFQNFFGATVFDATPEFLALYNLDPAEFGPYQVSTQRNLENVVRTEGLDFSYRQALTFLPHWARGLQVFANGSLAKTNATPGFLGASGFNEIPRYAAWGVSFTRPRYNLRLNWTWRADQNQGAVTGVGIEPDTFNYTPGYTKLDILGEFTVWKRVAVFANLRNVTDVADRGTTMGPNTPYHATLRFMERYGSLWTIGVKGTF
ncbi:TonB-dependent receptor [Horticoccus sp. 23ND18S-11]|uniref:TonB-dependent receptor n=1 Tax=Horticoccus sp. 23ND18S-11 TaxID=3391832 RepID=UPI0039C95527